MSGTTHMAVGVAIAVTLTQPKDIKESIFAVSSGIIGGIAVDVDTENAVISRIIRSILALIGLVLILMYRYKDYIDFELINQIRDWIFQGLGMEKLVCCLLFFALIMIGSFTKHRRVTHSVEFILCQTAILYFLNPLLALPFALAALSHTLLDLLNHKKVQVSLLLHKSLSFGICKANGLVDRLILLTALLYICIKAAL